jgi:hypothetical protein
MDLAAFEGEEHEVQVYLEFIFVLSLGIMLYCVTAMKRTCM